MRTVPVNQSAGPLAEGWEPFLMISILLKVVSGPRYTKAVLGHDQIHLEFRSRNI